MTKMMRFYAAATLFALGLVMPATGQEAKEPELKVLAATLARSAKAPSGEHVMPSRSNHLLLVVKVDGSKVSDATTKNVKLIVGKRAIKLGSLYSIWPWSGGEYRRYWIFSVPKGDSGAMTLCLDGVTPVAVMPDTTIVDELLL